MAARGDDNDAERGRVAADAAAVYAALGDHELAAHWLATGPARRSAAPWAPATPRCAPCSRARLPPSGTV